jgi:hypothetical protein
MSEPPPDDAAAAGEPGAAEPAPQPPPPHRAVAIILAGALIVVIGLVAAAPLWAPALTPLLPWAAPPAAAPPADPALAQRLDRLEAAAQADRQNLQQIAAAPSQIKQLEQRIAALEARPTQPAGEIAELRQQQAKLAAANADLAARLAALEGKPGPSAGDIADIRQELSRLAGAAAGLAGRVAALEKAERAAAGADPTDAALLLVLLQIRDAVDTARPFAAEYDAFAALAKQRPDIAAAAAALAGPAKSGVASRAVLIDQLRALAGTIATAQPAPAEPGWTGRVLARLHGLVTIRRIDGAGQSGAGAAVAAAEHSLAAGDLDAAVAALNRLSGAPADAARPWLQMARERLAVETALRHIEALLVARLGNAAAPPAETAPAGAR